MISRHLNAHPSKNINNLKAEPIKMSPFKSETNYVPFEHIFNVDQSI